jgi:branched-chain amino acid transport system substrate-binding protein
MVTRFKQAAALAVALVATAFAKEAMADDIFKGVKGPTNWQADNRLVYSTNEKGVKAKMVALLVAPPEDKFAELGEAAVGVIGPSQWEPQAKYSSEAAKAEGKEWYGPSVADFIKAYKATANEEPTYHSAGGYVAGLLLQKAIEKSGSTETAKVKAVLDAMDMYTFYGLIKFDATPKNHGLQTGHEMIYIQWQKDPAGKLFKQVVYPEASKTGAAMPYRSK